MRRRRLSFGLLMPQLARGIAQQAQVLNKVYGDIPTLIMEGDIVDISSYNEADTHNRIDAFVDTLPPQIPGLKNNSRRNSGSAGVSPARE